MEVTPLGNPQENRFSLSGTCPHCARPTVCLIVTGTYVENIVNNNNQLTGFTLLAGMQCQGCKRYILGIVHRSAEQQPKYQYITHYPLGKPNDDVPDEIPRHIASDFKEALRCRWVDAHNATVEMCRRAIQASCIDLSAPSDKQLVHQIDWLAQSGKITAPLKEMAHRIRLGGNLGAHPPEDPDDPEAIVIGPEYSDAVIEFTRDFFQHVYVMPERLKKFTFKKTQ